MSDSASPSRTSVGQAVYAYFAEFRKLADCPREFWVVQLVNLLDCVAYFATMTVATLYLSETLGYTDRSAALFWGTCMAVYTATGFLAGFLGDSIGIRRTLYLSVVLLLIGRTAAAWTEREVVVVPALVVLSIGAAIMTPILIAATRRYTTGETQSSGFNLLYLLMNIGAFAGNILLDPLRASAYGNRSIFIMGSGVTVICWLGIVIFWRKGIAQADACTSETPAEQAWEPPWVVAASVLRESAFWRFMLLLVVLVGVRLVFEHQYQIYPKYYQRTIPEHLFRAEAGLQAALDREEVTDELRQAFAGHDRALAAPVNVEVVNNASRWVLTAGEIRYVLQRQVTLQVTAATAEQGDQAKGEALTIPHVSADMTRQMNARRLPDALRADLAQAGVSLTESARLTRGDDPGTWTLRDGDTSYRIEATQTRLAVQPGDAAEAAEGEADGDRPTLFSLPVGTLGQLDRKVVTPELRAAFAEHDVPLGPAVDVTVNEQGMRWRLRDQTHTYYVCNDASMISVAATTAPIGLLNSLNPLIVCLGVIISTPIVARFKLFNAMFVGIVISSGSMLILCIDPGWFTGLWGVSIHTGYAIIILAQIAVFSLGELIWSPRLYEYTAAIAPPGREASYMGLSYAPMFFARFAEGPLADQMLTHYCPPDIGGRLADVPYSQSPQMMCLILALLAIASPVLIVALRGVIQKESRLDNEASPEPPAATG